MASSGQWPGGQRDGPGGPSSTAWASVSANCLPHGQGGGGIICAYPAGPAGRHPELVPHEPPAAAVQNGRTPHPACPVLHPATCRKLLDGEPLSSDSSAHRAARMASDVIESSTRERRR